VAGEAETKARTSSNTFFLECYIEKKNARKG